MCVLPGQERELRKKGSKAERDPQKLPSQLERLREINHMELRELWQTLFGAVSRARRSFFAELNVASERFRRNG
jgi:hypothetical protein